MSCVEVVNIFCEEREVVFFGVFFPVGDLDRDSDSQRHSHTQSVAHTVCVKQRDRVRRWLCFTLHGILYPFSLSLSCPSPRTEKEDKTVNTVKAMPMNAST